MMMRSRLAVLLLLVQMSPAQTPEALTLRTFIDRLVEHSIGLVVERLDVTVSDLAIERERAAFDPYLTATVNHEESEKLNDPEERARLLGQRVTDSRNRTTEAGIAGQTPHGTEYSFTHRLRAVESSISQDPYNNEWETWTGLELTQPLLRNRGTVVNRARLELASADAQIRRERLRDWLLQTVSEGIAAYWDLYRLQEGVTTATDSVNVAETLLTDNRERQRLGKMSELEVYQAETGLEMRRTQLANARHELGRGINAMRRLLSESASDGHQYHASDTPQLVEPEHDMGDLINRALQANPSYLRQIQELEKANVRLVVAKNQRWPQLDLTASYGINGLGDSVSESYDVSERADYPVWSIGLKFRMPLGGREARTELEAAKIRKEQGLYNLKLIEIEIVNAVDDIFDQVDNTWRRTQSFAKVVALNQRLLDVELQRIAAGKGNSRQVLDAEEDLSDAKLSYIRSQVELQKALLAVSVLDASLLDEFGIEVKD